MSVDDPGASDSKKAAPNEKEKAKIEEVRKLIGPAASKLPLECSDDSIIRYLTARNWNTKKAANMLKETLKWRMEYKPEKIKWDDVAHEIATGKLYIANYVDKYERTVIVMKPGQQNPNQPAEEQIKCLVFSIENAISNLEKGQEQMVWLVDFDKWNMTGVSMRIIQETVRILQDHYPERLAIVIFYNAPKVFESFWSLVKLFLDPKTYKKVKFVYSNQPQSMKIMESLFDMDKLDSAFGGRGKEWFNFEAYAKRMSDVEKRRFDAKSSGEAQPSIQTSSSHKSQDTTLLVTDVGSKISNEVESSSRHI